MESNFIHNKNTKNLREKKLLLYDSKPIRPTEFIVQANNLLAQKYNDYDKGGIELENEINYFLLCSLIRFIEPSNKPTK